MADEWAELFDNFGIKTVSDTDKAKGAYVPSTPQKYALSSAGLEPSSGEDKAVCTIGVLFDSALRSMQISYYNSERVGSGRAAEPRIGRGLPQWIDVGDELVIGNVGSRVFVAKEPIPPVGHVFISDTDGAFLTDTDGAHLTEKVEADLDQLTQELEAGRPVLLGNPADRVRRQKVIDQIDALRNELRRLQPEHGGIGHNKPPPDEEEQQEAEVLGIVAATADHLRAELTKPEPDAVEAGRTGIVLRNAAHWLAGKADVFADEFAKAFGKSLGENAGKALALIGMITLLGSLVAGVAGWLQAVTWPFGA